MIRSSVSTFLSAMIIILAISAGQHLWAAWRYDDSAPIVLRDFKIDDPSAVQGGRLSYSASYDKREDCHPPVGTGHVTYRFRSLDGNASDGYLVYDNVRTMRTTNWLPGRNLVGFGNIDIPPDLPPGNYAVTRTARYECAKASRDLVVTTPNIGIRVRAKG